MDEPKQQKLEFSVVFSDEEWGLREGISKQVRFFNHRIADRLPREHEGEVSNIQCPFCKDGCLKLAGIEPVMDREYPYGWGDEMVHIGDDYLYACTNESCDALFAFEHIWHHIF